MLVYTVCFPQIYFALFLFGDNYYRIPALTGVEACQGAGNFSVRLGLLNKPHSIGLHNVQSPAKQLPLSRQYSACRLAMVKQNIHM